MIVIKNIVREEDGTYSTSWSLTPEQMGFLVTYAINNLLLEGTISVEERTAQTEFLQDVPVEALGKAN